MASPPRFGKTWRAVGGGVAEGISETRSAPTLPLRAVGASATTIQLNEGGLPSNRRFAVFEQRSDEAVYDAWKKEHLPAFTGCRAPFPLPGPPGGARTKGRLHCPIATGRGLLRTDSASMTLAEWHKTAAMINKRPGRSFLPGLSWVRSPPSCTRAANENRWQRCPGPSLVFLRCADFVKQLNPLCTHL